MAELLPKPPAHVPNNDKNIVFSKMADPSTAHSADQEEEPPMLLTLFEPTTETICEFGDIILVADDGFHPILKIRVSSCILAMRSKPFRALFSKSFAEGQQAAGRSSSAPHEIEIKDRPRALRQLCQILHHISPLEDGKRMTASEVLDLAIIADKYDCVNALRLQAEALLEAHVQRESDFNQLDRLTAAAYLLDQPRHFRTYTKELVLQKTYIQAEDIEKRCADILPSVLFPSLFNQQNIARQVLNAQLTDIVDEFASACRRVSQETMITSFLSELRSRSLWPIRAGKGAFRLADLLKWMKSVQIPTIPGKPKTCREDKRGQVELYTETYGDWRSPTRRLRRVRRDSAGSIASVGSVSSMYKPSKTIPVLQPTSNEDMASAIKKVEELCVGVCLDCIRGRQCRAPHRYQWNLDEDKIRWAANSGSEDDDSTHSSDGGDENASVGSKVPVEVPAIHNTGAHPGYWEDLW